VVVTLSCIVCGRVFEQVHKRGRRRQVCFVCQPPGRQIVRTRTGRVKTRRWPDAPNSAEPLAS
jgi:hypothetical protein